MMTLILTALVGVALGVALGLLFYTKEWFGLYTKLAQVKQENSQLHNTIRHLELQADWRERGVTFEED